MTKNERLKAARVKSGLSQEELAVKMGVNQAYVGNLESSKGFSLKKARQIAEFLGADGDHIYFGEGKYGNEKVINAKNPTVNNEGKGRPYYDLDFIGGFDLMVNNQSTNPDYYIDFAPFNDVDFWVNVSGKSMGPLIAHGDIIGLKKVDDWKRFLLEGEIYAVVTDNGFRTIKMIGQGPDNDHYMLIPYNKGGDYNPQPIPKDVITHVFRVKGAIKKFF